MSCLAEQDLLQLVNRIYNTGRRRALHPQAREDQSIDGEMGATTEPIDPAGQEEVQNE